MYCKCRTAQEMARGQHQVKTITKALEWFKRVMPVMLPIEIKSDTCTSCGRFRFEVSDTNGEKIYHRG